MHLETPTTKVNKPAQYIFDSLTNVENFRKLMPDSIAKFEVLGDDSFIFGLSGMPEIKLRISEKTPPSKIVLNSPSEKLSFSLTGNITSLSDTESEVKLLFDGEFNAMMAMMIKGPISKFLETLSANMSKL